MGMGMDQEVRFDDQPDCCLACGRPAKIGSLDERFYCEDCDAEMRRVFPRP